MSVVLIDVDGVLASTSKPVAERLGAIYNPNLWNFGLSRAPEGFDHAAFWEWFGTIAGTLEVSPGAQEFVERARSAGFTIVFATSPLDSPTWCHDRIQWLKRNFGARIEDVMQGSRKDLLAAHALIDDKPENHSHRQELSILFDQPYNRGRVPEYLMRVYNFDDAYRALRGWA